MDGHFYELARLEAVWEDRALPARRTEHPARSRGVVATPAAGSPFAKTALSCRIRCTEIVYCGGLG
jgi:hypothetical protein